MGLLILSVGLVLVVVGLMIWAGGLSWLGRLPGDVRIQTEHATVLIPCASMILISIVLSLVLSLLSRLLR